MIMKMKYLKEAYLNGEFKDAVETFENFEFVEFEKIFQNLLYFCQENPLEINEDKTNKLFSMLRLLRLINSKGNDDSKVLLEKAILKEEKRNENDVDLAIYYLKHKELEEKLSKENKGGEVLIKN